MSDAELATVLSGLTAARPWVSPKWFYDALGSKLFEAITLLPEYYPTRCELEILSARAPEIARVLGPGVVLVELGSGVSAKVPLLLEAMEDVAAYVPVEFDGDTLALAARRLGRAFPGLKVEPIAADFTQVEALPAFPTGERTVVFYPGSTIGNLTPDDAQAFLSALARRLAVGDGLLLGFDLDKDSRVLEAAYTDPVGVTAAFNKNLLGHLNRRFGADFDPTAWTHEARYLPDPGRIEMHLRAASPQRVTLGGAELRFAEGTSIHTESSFKHDRAGMAALAASAGFVERACWTNAAGWFAVAWYERA